MESLTEALVDANDQLLAMYDMASLCTDTLDEAESVDHILNKARVLLRADALRWDPGVGPGAETGPIELVESERAVADGRVVAAVQVADPDGGTATLTARRNAAAFTTGDPKLLSAVAHLAMSAQHTARLHYEAVSSMGSEPKSSWHCRPAVPRSTVSSCSPEPIRLAWRGETCSRLHRSARRSTSRSETSRGRDCPLR